MSITNFLGLNIPDKNSKGRVVTDVFEPNFTKIDQNAEKLKTEIDSKLNKGLYVGTAENLHADDNAIWGGEYGGYIQDTSVTKVVGKRYIDQFDKKAYVCLKPSHENTITNYQACNVKDNLSKLNNLSEVTVHSDTLISIKRSDGSITYMGTCRKSGGEVAVVNLPIPLVFLTGEKDINVTVSHATSSIGTASAIYAVGSYVVDETTVKFNSTGASALMVFNINGFWKNPFL